MNEFPPSDFPELVGKYPAFINRGGGIVYDDILEYRVWYKNALSKFEFKSFVNYNDALEYHKNCSGSDEPTVLVRQKEWIDKDNKVVFVHRKEERITEWPVDWLYETKRKDGDIEEFIKLVKGKVYITKRKVR